MHTTRNNKNNGLWLLVVAGTLWGTGGLTGSLLARHTGLTSPAVAAYRLGLGGLVLVLMVVVTGRKWPRGRRAWTRITVVGLLAAGFQASYFAGVGRVSVSLATLLTIGAAPVLVLVAESALGRRRVDGRALVTVAIALGGLTLLIGVPEGGRELTAMLAGGGFALLAAAGFATMTIVGSRPVDGLDDLVGTGLAFTLGSFVLAPFAAAGGGLGFTPNGPGVGLLVALGVGPTAIAYAAYFRGLRTSEAGTAALMALLEPLVGTVLSIVVLGDRLGPAGGTGAVLLVVALFLEARRSAAGEVRPRSREAGAAPVETAGNATPVETAGKLS
ncbi:DMT family transporter [Actinoplanes sp. CA-030573]|uniref:DMT family transporter n=1 Tax=Actinoplanes sp. CA-030573 TaxID=3239898 RepID=UPI003D907C87